MTAGYTGKPIRFRETMNPIALSVGCTVALAATILVRAQDPGPIERLQHQLKQLEDDFARQQAEHRRQLEALQQQLEALRHASAQSTGAPPTSAAAAPPALGTASPESARAEPARSPTDPIRLLGNQQNYLHLALDVLATVGGSTANDLDRLQSGGHDPRQRGFTLQGLEVVFDGAVDPYFRAQANLVALLDSSGESRFELEEAYAETTSLPGNFQLKAGQYLTEFGRLNPTHPHTWAFVDQPLVHGRFFGEDGLRNPGARAAWLMPTPFYSELFLSVQNSHGETAHSFRSEAETELRFGRPVTDRGLQSMGDLLFAPRAVTSLDLSDTQTVLLGASAAFGPNPAGADTVTQLYGLDLFWKWKPVTHHGGFPFVSWQTEVLLRRYQAGAFSNAADDLDGSGAIDGGELDQYGDGTVWVLPRETLVDYGYYSQVAYGFRKGWVGAVRGDWLSGERAAYDPDPEREPRWRISPSLTWFPTEFSKLRLQYNYDRRQRLGVDHSIWLQFEFLLGAHAAHKF